MNLLRLVALGFDKSTHDAEEGRLRARCSQCEAAVIQGVPCHETGCPNARRRTSRFQVGLGEFDE